MELINFFLTVVLVVDCLFLILLILIQLPKKDAGAGVAFGAGAADALFGAGSGNALTKTTKYASAVFLGLALLLSVVTGNSSGRKARLIDEQLKRSSGAPVAMPPVAATPTNAGTSSPSSTLMTTSTNVPASPAAPPK